VEISLRLIAKEKKNTGKAWKPPSNPKNMPRKRFSTIDAVLRSVPE
jgi:hypothetical protein